MDPRFAALTDRLAPKLKKLLAMKPLRYGELPLDMPEKGIYLFSRGKKHLYIGRSNVLRKRYYRHFQSKYGATFAFLLARKATDGIRLPTKRALIAVRAYWATPLLRKLFALPSSKCAKWITDMSKKPDQVRQTLLEVYCAVVLQTPFNDFGTH
jgi:hypothetical protein